MLMALPLSWLGLLSHVLMEATKIPVDKDPCTTVPCRLEFPEEPLSNSMITGYWLNKNFSSPVATDKSNVIRDGSTSGSILWTLEERDCTLLIHSVVKRDNVTALSSAALLKQKSALLRENITLFLSDIPVAGEPVTLTCTIRRSCIGTKARSLSWKEPVVSFNPDGSRNSPVSSPVLRFTPEPQDRSTMLQCHLSFPLSNSTAVEFPVIIPPMLLFYVCSLEKIRQCSSSFYGIPTPTVQWLKEGVPVRKKSLSDLFQVMTTTTPPWVNSTVRFTGSPERIMGLHCEGKNKYGSHASSIFLIPDESLIPTFFMKGLIQGIVYGVIIPALFYFFLVLLIIKMLKWWVKRQIPKEEEEEEAPFLKEPELPEEPDLAYEGAYESIASVAGDKSLGPSEPMSTSQAAALLRSARRTI